MAGLLLARFLGIVPVGIKITGGKRDAVLLAGDMLYGRFAGTGAARLPGEQNPLDIDMSMPNERLLAYAAKNVVRHYQRSDLYAVMRKYIAPGGVFVDVGANLGIYSILAKTRLASRTVCFEPEPVHAAFLERNRRYFDEVYQVALSDTQGESTFHVAGGRNPGASSLVGKGEVASGLYAGEIVVKVDRLDRVMGEHDRIDMVKIDVEGNEAQTVRGMTRLFDRGVKPPIWCEVRGASSDRNPNSCVEVADILGKHGYRPYSGREEKPFDVRKASARRVFDLLFCAD